MARTVRDEITYPCPHSEGCIVEVLVLIRVGVKYFSKYLIQVQVLFHICKYKYKFKYSEYLEDIKYIKYFFNQVRVKYKYFGNKQ